MKKRFLGICLGVMMATSALCGCAPTTTTTIPDSSQGESNPAYATITSATHGKTVSLLSEPASTFAANYALNVSSPHSKQYCNGTEQISALPVDLSWAVQTDAQYYTLFLSRKADMSDAQSFITLEKSVCLEDLFMGTKYYYQVYAHYADKTVKSQVFHFETQYAPRILNVPGVSNLRDFGGYYTEDGTKRIKQGIVYRGAKFETAWGLGSIEGEKSKQKMLTTYGVKTDLDVRNPGETSGSSALGDTVNYVNVGGPYYAEGNGVIFQYASYDPDLAASYKQSLITEIRTFANPDNFPIFLHCSLGRDRTGTLCLLINALCGVSKRDLFLDYETSYFSAQGSTNWQTTCAPEILVYQLNAVYDFIDKGTCVNYSNQTLTNAYFPGASYSIADKTAAYMKGYLGITDAEIAAIRANMLEEV